MKKYKINGQIINDKITLVNKEVIPTEIKDMSLQEALILARNKNLDLVEMFNSDKGVSVCNLLDYEKFIYDKKKAEEDRKSIPVKEIRLHPYIEEQSYEIELKKINELLRDGHVVKVIVELKDEELAYKYKGGFLLRQVALDIGHDGIPEFSAKFEDEQLHILVYPIKRK